jgi:hypothetical protein
MTIVKPKPDVDIGRALVWGSVDGDNTYAAICDEAGMKRFSAGGLQREGRSEGRYFVEVQDKFEQTSERVYVSKSLLDSLLKGERRAEFAEAMANANERIISMARKIPMQSFPPSIAGFIHVPIIRAYVAKERSCLGMSWFDAHKVFHAQGDRMLTIPEFVAFLRHLRTDFPHSEHRQIFEDITEGRINSRRIEWLDASFKFVNEILHMNYGHEFDGKILEPKYSEEVKSCLMENRKINLADWLNRPTKQGLPPLDVAKGNLKYYHPDTDYGYVQFYVDSPGAEFSCSSHPRHHLPEHGARAVRRLPQEKTTEPLK